MKLYHGSSVGGLRELTPQLSEHGKPYIYFSSNPIVALLYAVKPVPKPFSYYPYGFEGETVVYSEYWKSAFEDIYKGKSGFLYECEVENAFNPTQINCAYVCEQPIKVINCIEIEDIYHKLIEYKQSGDFKIKEFNTISNAELNFVYDDFKNTIEKYNLKSKPDNEMSVFIRKHFPDIWRT